MNNNYPLHPTAIAKGLLFIMAVLVIFNLGTVYLLYTHGPFQGLTPKGSVGDAVGFLLGKNYVRLFNMDLEGNFPAVFSFLLLLFNAGLLFVIARVDRFRAGQTRKWNILGFAFAFLAVDEMFSLHEIMVVPMRFLLRSSFNTQDIGYFYFAWIVPYAVLMVFLGIYFLRFVLSLPQKTLFLFILSGLIFIGGAVGMEMVGGKVISEVGSGGSMMFGIAYTIEEMMEMSGAILFIYTLLSYLKDYQDIVSVKIGLEAKEAVPTQKDFLVATE